VNPNIVARGAEIGLPVPFEQLSADEQAIWRVFQPVKDWHCPDLRYEFVFDTANHQYQVLRSGWQGLKRLNAILIHIVIRDGYVWVEEDNTELEVAARLIEEGIPKDRIVLGFQAPYKRTLEGFASGQ
jgi:XisI protein